MWTVTIISSGIGVLLFFTGMAGAKSAVQEAASAAQAMAFAVIPYIMSRALEARAAETLRNRAISGSQNAAEKD
ncbi:hypothetical protein GCM10011529_27450 [Polymorphobacter glacialis]|uniref:Uncharacterized protein n=1 Tax=Sandarakinorhabdus glacialis TaxID=1614636 RepID=A0A917EAI9_9SPHN|nr:hypothetical protein GCM10011529_27450 [Polymorphobacter glacialis]